MRCSGSRLVSAAIITLFAANAVAGDFSPATIDHIGRWWGYGWGEGYHAYDNCPPRRRHSLHHGPRATPSAWLEPDNHFTLPAAAPQWPLWVPRALLKPKEPPRVGPQPLGPPLLPEDREPPGAAGIAPLHPEAAPEPFGLQPAGAIRVVSPPAGPERYPFAR